MYRYTLDMDTSSSMVSDLPNELVELVNSYAQPKDLLNIRLTSRGMAAKTLRIMTIKCFGELHVMMAFSHSLKRAAAVAKHAYLGNYIHTVTIHLDAPLSDPAFPWWRTGNLPSRPTPEVRQKCIGFAAYTRSGGVRVRSSHVSAQTSAPLQLSSGLLQSEPAQYRSVSAGICHPQGHLEAGSQETTKDAGLAHSKRSSAQIRSALHARWANRYCHRRDTKERHHDP